MQRSDFDYELPDELIAQAPLPERSASRLMVLDGDAGEVSHGRFTDVLNLIQPEDLLVFNNTRVMPARLYGVKQTGGRVEILIERIRDVDGPGQDKKEVRHRGRASRGLRRARAMDGRGRGRGGVVVSRGVRRVRGVAVVARFALGLDPIPTGGLRTIAVTAITLDVIAVIAAFTLGGDAVPARGLGAV